MENDKNTFKVLNTKTNEIFDVSYFSNRKNSYLVHFNGTILPFSKKNGKLYGRNFWGRNILHFGFYQLINF